MCSWCSQAPTHRAGEIVALFVGMERLIAGETEVEEGFDEDGVTGEE